MRKTLVDVLRRRAACGSTFVCLCLIILTGENEDWSSTYSSAFKIQWGGSEQVRVGARPKSQKVNIIYHNKIYKSANNEVSPQMCNTQFTPQPSSAFS